jgi:hypothetical protein
VIRVEITLDKAGAGTRLERIGYIEISNDLTGTATRANYLVKVFDRPGKRLVRRAHVRGWPRHRRTATALVAEALKQAFPEDS